MRILWVCNIMLPVIAEALGAAYSNKEGWLSGLASRILQDESAQITLGVCFPMNGALPEPIGAEGARKEQNPISGKLPGKELYYYSFREDTVHEETYDAAIEQRMGEIIAEFQPDIVHCFGAEYGHTFAVARVFARPQRTLIGLQGICAIYAEHYLDGIPAKVARRSTFRDRVRRDNLMQQKEKMKKRGERESRAFALAGHVTGRTGFDRRAAESAAPQAVYHFMNETMRSEFYEGCWTPEQCEKHRIFVSQGNYPIKGFHDVLRAMSILKKQYKDICVYVAGDSIVNHGTVKEKIKLSSYGKYLLSLIREGGLEDRVRFLGQLDAQRMKEQYLRAHVFVSASAIENSPNSVGEAMLLGVPVVSSEVGGVPDMLTDQKEGLLYHAGNVSALAMAVTRIFEDAALADRLSRAARERAGKTHDGDANYRRLLEIYHEMYLCQ